MITNLHIKNIGIIEDLNIDFSNGLNIISGETGAGKTLIIDSLQIISGGRFSKDMMRNGETNSFVELCMYIPDSPVSEDGNIIVSREIYSNGRNMCKINGRMVTVNELKDFMSNFIEIHGQNDTQKLLDNQKPLYYLDSFSGEKLLELKSEYKIIYDEFIEKQKELKNNYGDDKEKQRRIDLLKYQINEIEDANLKLNEDVELEEQRKIIANSAKISENLNKSKELLENSGIDSLSLAIRALEKIEDIDKKYEVATTNLKNLYYELQEVSRDISDYSEDICFDEQERDEIEERLNIIHLLKRKYGNTIEEILKYKEEISSELDRIENLDEYNKKLKRKIQEMQDKMNKIAIEMHEIRNLKAQFLSDNINKELKDLEMKNAKINIRVDYKDEFFTNGKDIVKFYIETNVGEEEKELSKIASGGEMSRIMLAIKKVLAEYDNIPILVFDEIDTGISGKAANSVGEKLKGISKKHQVLCISHLPNIVAKADYNYYISKNVIENRTKTQVKLLKEDEVIREIARISSGIVNDVTIKYATELRNKKVAVS